MRLIDANDMVHFLNEYESYSGRLLTKEEKVLLQDFAGFIKSHKPCVSTRETKDWYD